MKSYEEFPEFCLIEEGETPHGGVKTIYYFFDSQGNRCKEEDSTHCQIIELDKNGVCVFSLITGQVD